MIWVVELITNDAVGNILELDAKDVEKVDYHTLIIDGVAWKLPEGIGLSFAEVWKEEENRKEER